MKGQAMTGTIILAIATVALAGAAISIQGGANAALARSIGSPIAAATVSFLVGSVALTVLTLSLYGSAPFRSLAGVPSWQLIGGILGAYYVCSVTWGLPQLGVLTTMAALILGQVVTAMVIDATGAFGLPVHPVSPQRLVAAALVGAGLLLSRG